MWKDSHENRLALAINIVTLPLLPLVMFAWLCMAAVPVFVVGYLVYVLVGKAF